VSKPRESGAEPRPSATPDSLGSAALSYARANLPVLPLNGKIPRIDDGLKGASTDPAIVGEWWRRWPEANIGIRTGAPSGLIVLDVDQRHNGIAGLEQLKKRHGALPATAKVLTGSGGWHWYFKHPGHEVRNSAGVLGKGLDVRGDGGYVVAPPSVHPDTGNPYKWLHNLDEVADAPDWFAAPSAATRKAGAVGDTIPEGQRDATLASLAGTMRRRGMGEKEIRAALLEANKRCVPPLPTRDIERIASSVARYEPEQAPEQARPRIIWQDASEVEPRSIVFVDKPLLQADAFHLIAGRKGQGKGTVLASIAARVARGELGNKRNVIWIGSEDSAAIDIVPRLIAAGGNPARVRLVKEGWIQLPRDIDEISAAITDKGDVGMVVIDPIANHIAGKDSNTEEIREAIAPLNKVADDHKTMVFGVRHLTEKDASRGVLAAILGSSAWVQVPRAVLAVARDNEDPSVRHIQCVAGNRLPPDTPGRMFRIEGVKLDGLAEDVTRAVWIGDSSCDVETLLRSSASGREQSRSSTARELVLDTLEAQADRQMESDTLDALVARELGLEAKTVRNIRSTLKGEGLIGVTAEKDDSGKVLRWLVYRTLAPREVGQIPTPDSLSGGNGSTTPDPEPDPVNIHYGIWTSSSPDPDSRCTGPGSGPRQPGPGDCTTCGSKKPPFPHNNRCRECSTRRNEAAA
jgi:hypothetical protein